MTKQTAMQSVVEAYAGHRTSVCACV